MKDNKLFRIKEKTPLKGGGMKKWRGGLGALALALALTACTGPGKEKASNETSSLEISSEAGENPSGIIGKKIEDLRNEPVEGQGQWVESVDGEKFLKESATFYDTFDTIISVTYFTQSQEAFDRYVKMTHQEFQRLHQLFDTFHNVEGGVNAKTINDQAGKAPVKVPDELYDLISFSLRHYEDVSKKVNIGIGRAVALWNQGREEKKVPDLQRLKEISQHIDPANIILNDKEKTVFIKDPEMALDLGAVGKGYATELVAKKLEAEGLGHGLISAGGNVRTIGGPIDGRKEWTVGIADPRADEDSAMACTVQVGPGMSVVTSGDYQRYFIVDGIRYHHILNPKTLQPQTLYPSVTVVTQDSGLADLLSTAFFLSTKEEAKEIRDRFSDEKIELIWVDENDKVSSTPDLEKKIQVPSK